MNRPARVILLALAIALLSTLAVHAVGVSFAYLLPRGGSFSNPVAPLSFRDIGLTFGRYVGVAGNLSLYSIRGMGVKDSSGDPIDTGGPVVGPFLSVLGSAVAKVVLPLNNLEIEVSGGAFGAYLIDPPLMSGTIDRYLATATATTYETVTSTVSSSGRWAWGWVFGGTVTYFVKGQFGISAGVNYYLGGARLNLSGSYDAYDSAGAGTFVTNQALPEPLGSARLDFTGLEIILGVDVKL